MTSTDIAIFETPQQLQAGLQRALQHLQQNQAMMAEALLTQILARHPREPDALQLLGILREEQGRLEEAENFYRQSLNAKPDQPHVHHNLGNLLKNNGLYDEAIAEQREAIRLKRNYIEAHLNLGLALSAKGDHVAAEKAFRNALHIQPNSLVAKQSLGAALNDLDRPKDAETVLRQALAAGSSNPRQVAALEHNLGVSLLKQERYPEALQLFDCAKAKVPDMPLVDGNRGNALQHMGSLDGAIDAYRAAIALNPLNFSAHNELNTLLYRMGDDKNFLRSYDAVAARFPDTPMIALERGWFLLQRKDFAAAKEQFEHATAVVPNVAGPFDALGLCLAHLGDFEGAVRAHEGAVKNAPEDANAWRNYAETLLRMGDAATALTAAEKAIQFNPAHQGNMAMWGIALQALGDPRSEWLNDYQGMVQVFDLEPPSDFSDIESFNHELNAELDRLHMDRREPLTQSLQGGTQTLGNLFGRGHPLVEALRARIDNAVTAYIERMKKDETHPLFKRRSKAFAYAGSWSSRLRDCGFHVNHYHQKGWISSAYYVDLPRAVEVSDDQQGWIKFGEPSFEAGLKKPVARSIQPRPGRLVLFPSYMWHGTIPFSEQHPRTTVAFDVTPR